MPLAVFAMRFALVGCASAPEVVLTAESITLTVGEARDILPYVRFVPDTAADRTVTLSSDGDCIEIDGTTVIAVSRGKAEVAVSAAGGYGVMTVAVEYRAATGLVLTAGETAVQTTVGKPSAVEFSLSTDDFADPDASVEWEVDGERVDADGHSFTYMPDGYGEFDVAAHAHGMTARTTVKVYRPSAVSVAVDGALEQSGNFSPVRFIATERIDTRNPASVYVWTVNGEARSESPIFEFSPTVAGEYKIRLSANGKTVKIDGKDEITITASGERAPIGEVAFDDLDGVFVKWSDGEYVTRVSVIAPDGTRRNFDRSDAQHAYRFGRGVFDASDLIEICAQDPATYAVVLNAEGVREFDFAQYPLAAGAYLDDKPFISNTFVSDADDGAELIDEIFACGLDGVRCYLGRGAENAVDVMLARCAQYGMGASVVRDGAELTFAFADYVNAPKQYETVPNVTRMYSELPHIEYSADNRRAQSYALAVERLRKSVDVCGSEQLLTAVMRGIRPLPVAGSTAAVQYSAARGKLLGIIGSSYTDAQKVHAVYDWLQWVTVCSTENDPDLASGYIESVLGSAEIGRGDARRAVVTSAGAAKMFALMCGMEGIKTAIVSAETDGGTYYYNKVEIDGLWYNADVFGGKASSAELGITRKSEFSTHRGLFFTDDRIFETVDPLDARVAFDAGLSVYVQKYKRGGVYYDRYVDGGECDEYALIKAAVYDGFESSRLGNVSVPVVGGTETYVCNTLGAELALDGELDEKTALAVCAALYKAADEYAKEVYGKSFSESAVRVYRINNLVHLTAVAPNKASGVTTGGESRYVDFKEHG